MNLVFVEVGRYRFEEYNLRKKTILGKKFE